MAQKKDKDFIHSGLPVRFQCLRVPCEVRAGVPPQKSNFRALAQLMAPEARERGAPNTDPQTLYWEPKEGTADTYDPWEQRGRFLQINEGEEGKLIEFLNSIGLFEPSLWSDPSESTISVIGPDGLHYIARYISAAKIDTVWQTRRMIENSLRDLNRHTGRFTDFTARIILAKGQPNVTITTCTFLDSLLLTLAVDRVQKAKVRKCARHDCRALFSSVSAHGKKFCSWYCGHLESVRESRKRAKRAKSARRTQ